MCSPRSYVPYQGRPAHPYMLFPRRASLVDQRGGTNPLHSPRAPQVTRSALRLPRGCRLRNQFQKKKKEKTEQATAAVDGPDQRSMIQSLKKKTEYDTAAHTSGVSAFWLLLLYSYVLFQKQKLYSHVFSFSF